MAVDWDRLVTLDDPRAVIATSLVPAGIPGAGDGDFTPRYDPDAARAELAAAGHPGGDGLAPITMITGGGGLDEAVAAYAVDYADQTERDHAELVTALRDGDFPPATVGR